MKYIAEISLTPKNNIIERIGVELKKTVEETYYDDLLDTVYKKMDKEYPKSDFPKADIYRLWICDEGTEYPVVAESDAVEIKKLEKSKKFKKFLVLPELTYSLTPECRLWMEMKDSGMIDEYTDFDYNKFHKIILKFGIGDENNNNKK